ncbi:DUF4185 domain-containing protein [Nocardia stercoris]|uniref:DUF4185 domain-containing protein n=1 Tax=Nocardia stercoris TaxID=2483361 RepID=A0A3M2LCI0_9NOCA|nr:DUF4185 domain-containing protein [Nocardia stercoris]RMI34420.1 DUF4185 domain-containing protein [Nocardia stercoris]
MRKASTPGVFGLVVACALHPAPAAAAPAPWAPPPVNACGETGFDPRARLPEPGSPPPPLLPPHIDIQIPVPQLVPVPIPGPAPDNERIDPGPLPTDPCRNPCPEPGSDPDNQATTTDPELGSDETPLPSYGPDAPADPGPPPDPLHGLLTSLSGGGSNGNSVLNIPSISFSPDIEPIPIPVPGGVAPPPQPAPEPVVHPAEPGPAVAPLPAPQLDSVHLVNQVTGPGSINRTDVRWQVNATDLGIMWQTKPGEIATVFGDTFGKGWQVNTVGGPDEDWRSNVLGYSTQTDLSKGLTIERMVQDSKCHAAELLDSRKLKNFETTVIPTSGFALGNRQYLSYMSINKWSRIPGMWWTNRGGLAYSDDDGQTWVKSQHAVWDNMFGLDRFQVAAMVPHGAYVYMFGTPNGRVGNIGLARVPTAEVLNKTAYQYWVNGTWAPTAENSASPILPGIAGELSVRYDESSGHWQMVYLDPAAHSIVLRIADEPQGNWSDEVPLVDTNDYPKSYGGFIHPWSTGNDIYFTISAWDTYNVYFMRATFAGDP